jgi:hypothetical protein
MAETQSDGVQMKALRRMVIQREMIRGLIAINRITNDRVSDACKMGSQLMGATGDGSQPNLGDPCGTAAHTPEGARLTPLWMGAIAWRLTLQPCQTVVDAPMTCHDTADMGQIKLVDASVRKQNTGASQRLQPSRQQQHT